MGKRKIRINIARYIALLIYIIAGAVCGVVISWHETNMRELGAFDFAPVMIALLMLACVYLALFIQLVVHEAGHLVFGLLTGYRFSSYRVGSIMFMREGGKLRVKRLSLMGTGGQCLMLPPDASVTPMPYAWYNLGGVILNLVCAGLCALGAAICVNTPVLPAFLLMMTVMGVAFAITNGVPMRVGNVDNDGRNALSLGRDACALSAFRAQLETMARASAGERMRDMPKEFYVLPPGADMKNAMIATMRVYECNRLMDLHAFDEALKAIDALLDEDTAIVGLHRKLLTCDRVYLELIGDNDARRIEELMTKEQKKLMKVMKRFPTVIRVNYARALLGANDSQEAEKLARAFEACAKSHPYKSDIESERELMDIARERWEAKRDVQTGQVG